jgi:muramoyltetrapeptide carboxypeptidase
MEPMRVGIVAACSAVGQVELALGTEMLRESGFEVKVHPQCARQHFTFAGTDEERAEAFYEYAIDDGIDVIWCARGGYGAGRLLPILRKLAEQLGAPSERKLLVGYSDVTMLHEFVRKDWSWGTLHAPMPAANLRALRSEEWTAIVDLVGGRATTPPWQQTRLRFLTDPPSQPIRAELIGGNLSLWTSLAGTDFQPRARRRILFFEDLSERPYRIDRMLTQVVQSGMLDGAAAIVLGDFTDCDDENNQCLKTPADDESWQRLRRGDWSSAERMPLRKVYSLDEALGEIFGTVGRRMGIPVAAGLPVGHGPNFSPLPLGARYELRPEGSLRLMSWKWLRTSPSPGTPGKG